uniref:Uncharacterized protein n=1 Tax=Physcomitrium patens TaxID=3218 RepID=A0A7I4ANQ4_PHYPA
MGVQSSTDTPNLQLYGVRFYSGARIRLCGATCFKSSVAISCGLSVVACNIKPVQLLFLVTASCKSAGCTANTERRQSAPELGAKLSTSFLINRGQPFPNSDFKSPEKALRRVACVEIKGLFFCFASDYLRSIEEDL